MKYLVFDTETTGLPKNFRGQWGDLNNWPRMTQLAFILMDDTGMILSEFSSLIKPDGWVVPKEKFFLDNNMSTERCYEEGNDIFDVLRHFQEKLKIADYKVAHNLNFDNPIVGSEMIRAGITSELFKFKRGLCTMQSTTKYCNIPFPSGKGTKWPKLEELHLKLFNKTLEGAHDALVDVAATGRCLIECINQGIIKI